MIVNNLLLSRKVSFVVCHYTFISNEVNSVVALFMLIIMGIFVIFAVRTWTGNRIDEANEILQRDSKVDKTYNVIFTSTVLRGWFQKGYKYGST